MAATPPPQQGLYDPRFEHDACGIGFVVDVRGRPSHDLLQKGVEVLKNLGHRGACGSEKNTGDGAGLLFQIPHQFFAVEAARLHFELPEPEAFGVGMVFLPHDLAGHQACEKLFEQIVAEEGQEVLGWRTVPVDDSSLGGAARSSRPMIRQIFIRRSENIEDAAAFERKLYVIRKRAENAVRWSDIFGREFFYVASLSCRTIVYKGMLTAEQLPLFYPDLTHPAAVSALVLVHSRFSTNTFPNWARAHPYRYVAHNGEINTLRGNVNWMRARQSQFASRLFGDDMPKIFPVIDETGSDSAMFDNALELLVLAGRPLPHSLMMMVPEPWSKNAEMPPAKRDFYEYHACLMEPWDGPASMVFTDGTRVGAILDRNGLRPSRYYRTADDLLVVASEVGVLDMPADRVVAKGRLEPGRMLLVDLAQGRIISDGELKSEVARARPYGEWLREHLKTVEDLPPAPPVPPMDAPALLRQQQAFGYTNEDLKLILSPMAQDGREPIGSMGTDTPLAVLSERPQLLYHYFKQLFAQVTNPPVDAIREELVMATETYLGSEENLLEPGPDCARRLKLDSPLLDNEDLARLRRLEGTPFLGFKAAGLSMLFEVDRAEHGLEDALEAMFARADEAIAGGANLLILSDRGVNRRLAPVPALLAVSGLHHHLIRRGTRTRVALIVESAEPREVHHFALLCGYGASAINPYMALETLTSSIQGGLLNGLAVEDAVRNYLKGATKGIVKVMSKMGISAVQSYHGAQIFEAIGLASEVIDRYFTGTPSRVAGVGLAGIVSEVRHRHQRAFGARAGVQAGLDGGGQYQWRLDGEQHLFNPETIHRLQHACRTRDYALFKEYSRRINDQAERLCTLRGLFELRPAGPTVSIDEVEPVEAIVKRFKSGAMSYGSISKEAHETLAIAMNRLGGKSNTGEGGEDPARYVLDANGDSRNSAIKQVASARFGVTSQYLVMARELQIKMAQGAKPGEGGQLPGHKVYPWIARVRHSTPGVGLISPPPHHDIYSIEDLAQLIHDLKNANSQARISVKLVSEVGVGTIAAGVAKAHADVVLISGHDGGTGASPLTSIKHAGAPWELGLAETHQTLVLNDLRSRIAVEVDGQLKTGRDVIVAALLGAEEFGFATAPLVALGCIMMRVCHLNTCPVGVATQDPQLRKNFKGDPEHIVNFMRFIAQEMRELMAELGFRTLNEMVGRTDCLETRRGVTHFKARGLDFSRIFYQPDAPPTVGRYCRIPQDHGLDESLDRTTLLDLCRPALEQGTPVSATLPIRNAQRVVGTMLGSELTRRHGAGGLPEDTIRLHFKGSAGQSFGAFIPAGMTLILEGDSNDYLAKGLSGGKIIHFPPAESRFVAEENVITGNVALYGATSGEAYVRGLAGERFAVRNSGASAVVEGVGDHGCEYMTGGRVVVLGPTGRNFAAGMSGGFAYVFDEAGKFADLCNQESVRLFSLEDEEDRELVQSLVRKHAEYTGSPRAWKIIALWSSLASRFVKVSPNDYRRVQENQRRFRASGLTAEAAEIAAFQENAHDLARAGGN